MMTIEELAKAAKAAAPNLSIQVCQSEGEWTGWRWAIHAGSTKNSQRCAAGSDASPEDALARFLEWLLIRPNERDRRINDLKAELAALEREAKP